MTGRRDLLAVGLLYDAVLEKPNRLIQLIDLKKN